MQYQNILNEYKETVRQDWIKSMDSEYSFMLKYIFERKAYYHKYYRDFPNDDKAYIIDYLMNKKATTKTFLVTILDLISQNKILIEKSSNDE